MPITPQEVADVLNTAGVDTPDKFGLFIGFANNLIQRNLKQAEIERLRAERAAHNQEVEEQIQSLAGQVEAIDRSLRGQ